MSNPFQEINENVISDPLYYGKQYTSFTPNQMTYNRQEAVKRFELADQIKKDNQKIMLQGKGVAPLSSDDLLTTNNLDYSFTNDNTMALLANNRKEYRYQQEIYRQVNVNSRSRMKFRTRPVTNSDRECFPDKMIWDQYFNSESETFENIDLCCITFNNVMGGFDQQFPYFTIKEGQLYINVPEYLESDNYKIVLKPPPKNIRQVRLRSVEVPKSFDIINKTNNLLMLDVINPCTGESFPYPDDLDFALILLSIGIYSVEEILQNIVDQLNLTVRQLRASVQQSECDPFSYIYNSNTGEVTINSELEFHLKFWFSTSYPQFNLFEILGYPYPFPRNDEGNPIYVKSFSNLIEQSSPLTSNGLTNKIPYQKPNLNIYDYIFLAIDKLDVIQDQSVTNYDIFAKILINDNGFIGGTKIFQTPLEKLEELRIYWIDAYGNPVEFNGQENSFLLEFIEEQDKLKNADFSSNRGLNNFDNDICKIAYKTNVD